MLVLFLSGEFLLHSPCWLHFYLGSFSYTSRAGFIFLLQVSITHPMLALFFCGEFLLHIPCWLFFLFFNLGSFFYTSRAGFIFMRGVSFTHPVLALVLSWEFLLHIPACFVCVCGGGGGREFLLDIPCWFYLYLGVMIRNWCCSFVICSYETVFLLPSFCLQLWRWGWPVNDWNVFLLPLVYLWDCILQHGGSGKKRTSSSWSMQPLRPLNSTDPETIPFD